MFDADDRELITTERVGLITYILLNPRGAKYTTAHFANVAGVTHEGAWRILTKLSRVLPVCRDMDGWYMLPDD